MLALALMMSLVVTAQTVSTKKHEVQAGETLYSIARQYGSDVASLLKLNPGLDAEHILAGQTINVPATGQSNATTQSPVQQQVLQQVRQQTQAQKGDYQIPPTPNRPRYKTLHEVQKRETIYSISRMYGVTEDQLIAANPSLKKGKLKKGAVLNIPYTTEDIEQYQVARKKAEEEIKKSQVKKIETIKVAIILPFSASSEKVTAEGQKMTNMYQGFLLAVDSLKQHGYNVEVFAYDEVNPSTTVTAVLYRPELKDMNLIIGPMRQWNVKGVADFAHQHGIAHVVPLSNDLSLVNEHPTTFQLNSHGSIIYSMVYNRFTLIHKNHNIIFVSMGDKGDNLAYISDFKADLEKKGITYSSAIASDFSTVREALKTGTSNIIIPSSGSPAAFETLAKKMDGLNLTSEYNVQFFGFPEWQMLAAKFDKYKSKYQCQFFTSFYSNSASSRTQSFNAKFRRWFDQDQYTSYPKYGEMGYDIGAYFLKGIHDFGSAFYENLHNYSYISMEFPMAFEKKNEWSGYQNKALQIVTYRSDGTVFVR